MANPNKLPVLEIFGPTIQGEGAMIGVQTTFIRTVHCDYACAMCIDKDQRVLMADWSLKPISQIEIGDIVFGMQDSEDLARKRLVPTRVSNVINQGTKETIRITTQVGGFDKKGPYKGTSPCSLICTSDHKLLNVKWRTYYQPAETCQDAVLRAAAVYEPNDMFWLGWLHGVMQGDGNIHKFKDTWWRMKISCEDVEIRDKVHEVLTSIGAPNPHKIDHNGGNGAKLLPGVEVTNHVWVDEFREDIERGIEDSDYKQGWLAGFYDTDGHFDSYTSSARISQSHSANPDKVERCLKYLSDLGFHASVSQSNNAATDRGITSMTTIAISHYMEFLTRCPGILRRKKPDEVIIGKMPRAAVKSIEKEGISEVWDITTDTGNFICEGIIVHNCDSKHAVEIDQYKGKEKVYTALGLWEELQKIQGACEWVTISGGNPALWDFSEFVKICQAQGVKVAVETQGSVWKPWLSWVDQLTVSPKGPGMKEPKANVLNDLQAFFKEATHDVLLSLAIKIPVFSEEDLDFAETVQSQIRDICKHGYYPPPLYLSVGNTILPGENETLIGHRDMLLESMDHMIAAVLRRPNLSHAIILPQLHVLVYGNKQLV